MITAPMALFPNQRPLKSPHPWQTGMLYVVLNPRNPALYIARWRVHGLTDTAWSKQANSPRLSVCCQTELMDCHQPSSHVLNQHGQVPHLPTATDRLIRPSQVHVSIPFPTQDKPVPTVAYENTDSILSVVTGGSWLWPESCWVCSDCPQQALPTRAQSTAAALCLFIDSATLVPLSAFQLASNSSCQHS